MCALNIYSWIKAGAVMNMFTLIVTCAVAAGLAPFLFD